jgi:hypothetical protein
MGKRLVVASGRHKRRFRNQRRPEAVFSHRLAKLVDQIQDLDFREMNDEDRDQIVKKLEDEAKADAKARLHLKSAGR